MNQSLILLSYFNKQNDDVGIDYTKLIINISQIETGDFTNSLKESFEILARFEKRKDDYGRMTLLSSIANAFAASKNYDNAIVYYKKILSSAKFLNDSNRVINTINDIGYTYAIANMPDSGLVYAQQAVDLSDTYRFNKAYSLSTLGENYMVKREYNKALPLLRKSYAYLYNDAFATASILSDFVECFMALNKKDSAMQYAQTAIDIADKNEFNNVLLRTYESLYKFFDKTNNSDSSSKYFRLATAIKDSIEFMSVYF